MGDLELQMKRTNATAKEIRKLQYRHEMVMKDKDLELAKKLHEVTEARIEEVEAKIESLNTRDEPH